MSEGYDEAASALESVVGWSVLPPLGDEDGVGPPLFVFESDFVSDFESDFVSVFAGSDDFCSIREYSGSSNSLSYISLLVSKPKPAFFIEREYWFFRNLETLVEPLTLLSA